MEKKIAPVITKVYDFILWLLPKLERFPRSQRFLLADKIEMTTLNILELLIEANYSQAGRKEILNKVNLKIDNLRFLMRISKDMHYINLKGFEYQAKLIDEIGRMTGGWAKAAYNKQQNQGKG